MGDDAPAVSTKPDAKRSWPTRVFLLLLVVFVIYPLSFFPVALVLMWLTEYYGLMTIKTAERIIETMYFPVIWAVEKAPLLGRALEVVGRLFGRLAPK